MTNAPCAPIIAPWQMWRAFVGLRKGVTASDEGRSYQDVGAYGAVAGASGQSGGSKHGNRRSEGAGNRDKS